MRYLHTTLHHLSFLASLLLALHTSRIDPRIERLTLKIAFGCKPNTGDDVEVECSATWSVERERKARPAGRGIQEMMKEAEENYSEEENYIEEEEWRRRRPATCLRPKCHTHAQHLSHFFPTSLSAGRGSNYVSAKAGAAAGHGQRREVSGMCGGQRREVSGLPASKKEVCNVLTRDDL